jgi:hypothetical protein
MPEGQADVLASENIQLLAEHLPSKGDVVAIDTKLDGVAARLDAKIDGVEARLTARIDSLEAKLESLESRLLLRMAGLIVAIEALFRLL